MSPLCRHCGRPKGGRGHEPRTEGDTIHLYEPRDWAEECALNWVDRWHSSGIDFQAAIEGAVREALAKAAHVVETGSGDVTASAAAIRALGATK